MHQSVKRRRAVILDAREGFPLEVCGILGGEGEAVSAIYRMTNSDAGNEHFTMEPKEQFATIKDLRARGVTMLAIYHSHPETPARPSPEDIKLAVPPRCFPRDHLAGRERGEGQVVQNQSGGSSA